MSQYQQNWNRINAELRNAVDRLSGPTDEHDWSEFGTMAKNVFTAQVVGILQAEFSHRFGDESRVNVRIRKALENVGEQIVRDLASAKQVARDV